MFKKYTSIENSYREKTINDFFERHPEMREARWGVTEKIDGSNISFIFEKQEDQTFKFSYAKRSGLISEGENFFGIQNVIKEMDAFIKFVTYNIHAYDILAGATTFTMFGEFFGPSIQKRIDYGDKKRIEFFDIAIDGVYISQATFYTLMKIFDPFTQYTVPLIEVTDSFDKALLVDTHFNANHGPKQDPDTLENECEGVVIKPWLFGGNDLIDQYGHAENFYIKNKNEKFADKMKVKHREAMTPQSEALTNAQNVFESYLTENRIADVFSKEGMIEDCKDMGRYIKLIMLDAKGDFMKDHIDMFTSEELTEKERGKVFKTSGKVLSKMLMKYV